MVKGAGFVMRRSQVQVIVIAIFLGEFCPRGKGAVRLALCEAPTHETRPDHNTGNYVLYSSISVWVL